MPKVGSKLWEEFGGGQWREEWQGTWPGCPEEGRADEEGPADRTRARTAVVRGESDGE